MPAVSPEGHDLDRAHARTPRHPRDDRAASRHRLAGSLYAITPDAMPSAELLPLVEALFDNGLRVLQLRRKRLDHATLESEARALVAAANRYGAQVIVNDNLALAKAVGAHGVHWGRDDASSDRAALRAQIDAAKSKERRGDASNDTNFIVGISCYADFSRAATAADAGADYVAFGAVFPSATKPAAVQADCAIITRARHALNCSVVAIGGITRDNAHLPIRAGANAVAVISDLFGAPSTLDAIARLHAFQRLLSDHHV
jgi:thiamine-phosphate pyrophosphorylase